MTELVEHLTHRTPAAAPAHLPVVGHVTLLPPKILAIIAQSLPPDDIRSFLRTCRPISSAKAEIELAIRRCCRQVFHQFFSHIDMKILTRKPLESLRTLSERQVVKLLIQEILDQLTLQNTLPSKVIIQYLLISFLGTLNDPQFHLLKSAIATAHLLKGDFQRRTIPPNHLRSTFYGAIEAGKILLTSSHRSLTGSLRQLCWQPVPSAAQRLQAHEIVAPRGTTADFKSLEKEFSKIVVPIFTSNYFQPNPLAESDLECLDQLHQFSRSNSFDNIAPWHCNFAPFIEGLAEMQRIPRAFTISRTIADINIRNAALYRLSFTLSSYCNALTKLQRFHEAFVMANMIINERSQSEALFKISIAAMELKKFHLAISVARIISIPLDRDQAYLHIFEALINLQRFILATAIAQKIHWKWQKEQLLLILCWHLGKLERFSQANAVAHKIANPEEKNETLRLIDEHKKLVTKIEAHWQFAALFS